MSSTDKTLITTQTTDEVDIVDLSDETNSAKAIREDLRCLVSSLTDYAIIRLDPQGVVNAWSAGAETLNGYTSNEILGQHFSRFFTPEDRANNLPATLLNDALVAGKTHRTGWRVHKDGHRFWGEIALTALYGETGELIGFIKVARDLTARHNADEASRRSEEQFRLLINSVTDYAIIGLDPNGTVETWNSGAERIEGYTEHEIIGQHFSVFYSAQDQAAGIPTEILETARKKGHAEKSGWRVRKNGSHFWGDVVVTALRNMNGELIGYIKITRDLSERYEAEEAARQSAERDEHAAAESRLHQLRSEFMQSISHDLRTPLASIKGFASLLRSGNDSNPQEREEFARLIEHAADRLTAMVDDLLELAKLESGAIQLNLEPTPLRQSADAAVALLQPILKKREVDLQIDASLRVQADAAALGRIFVNLISNAAKFSSEGTPVKITADATDKQVVVSVIDEGPGVADDDKQAIFQRFHQGSRTSHEHTKGSGIGLSMVHDYVELHGGNVWVEDGVDKGAQFVFTLSQSA